MNQEADEALHLGYIERCWETVASIAWKEYTIHGRGALFFTPGDEGSDDWDCVYLPLKDFEGAPFAKECCDFMNEYDPMEQIVAVFLTPPNTVSGYYSGLTPERIAPPEAFKRFGYTLHSN